MSFTLAQSATALESQANAWDEALEGAAVAIAGIPYAAAVLPSPVQPEATPEGWQQVQTLRVDVRKTLLAAKPVKADSVVWDSHRYFITSIGGDAPGALTWTLHCRRIA